MTAVGGPAAEAAAGRGPAGEVRDDTDDLRLRLVRFMLWGAVGLVVLIRAVASEQNGLPVAAWFGAMLSYPPLVVMLARPMRARRRTALVMVLVALWAVPFAVYGWRWQWMPWTVAAAVLCAFRGRLAGSVFGLVGAGTLTAGLLAGDGLVDALLRANKTMIDGLIVFGIYALAAMAEDLHATRGAAARLRTRQERHRLDADVRAVLGAEVADLCAQADALAEAGDDPEAVAARVGAAVDTARRALAAVRSTAGDYRGRPQQPPAPITSPAMARWVLVGVYACQSVNEILEDYLFYGRLWTLGFLVLLDVAIGYLVLVRPTRGRLAFGAVLLLIQYFPLGLLVKPDFAEAVILYMFLAGVVLVRVRRPLSWAITGFLLAVNLVGNFYPPPAQDVVGVVIDTISFVIITWVTYSLLRLAELVRLLHQAHADLAREAVLAERTRIARDLHDVVSFSLSAVVLQGEVCRKRLMVEPEAARAHLAELPKLAHRARTELSSLAEPTTGLRWEQELASAREVLAAAGIETTTSVEGYRAGGGVDGDVAAVLREAVTNIVKHSNARTCSIAVSQARGLIRLRVVNDGVGDVSDGGDVSGGGGGGDRGSGLTGMAERTGGRLTARPLPPGRFEVVAEFTAGRDRTPAGNTV